MGIAFLFPGQGSQYVGMGKQLFERFPVAREVYLEAERVLGWDVARLCFEGPEAQLNQTEYTQPAILTTSIAAWRALGEAIDLGKAAAGHSLGEYSALVATGTLSFPDAVHIVHLRGRFMQEAVPEGQGAMAAIIGLGRKVVDDLCRHASTKSGVVSSANYNGPNQVVVAGEVNSVKAAMERALKLGAKRAILLPVSVPSHCPLMKEASLQLAAVLEGIEGDDFQVPLINNLCAKKINTWKEARAALVDQITSPLLWEETITLMLDDDIDSFLEIGPGRVLSGLVKRIHRQAKVLNVEDPVGVENGSALLNSARISETHC